MFDSLSRSFAGVQHIAHLAREPVGRKWLLQEGAPGRQRAVLYDRIPRIAPHVEPPNPGPLRGQAISEIPSRHARHHDVGQEQVDRPAVTLHHPQCRGGVGSGEDDVTLRFERTATECQYGGLVLDEEDRLTAAGRPAFLWAGRARVGGLGPRQIDLEARAVPRLRVYGDVAAALLHDPIHRGEPEPRSLADLLRPEEWLEKAGAGRRLHSGV